MPITDADDADAAQAPWRALLQRLGGAAAYEELRRRLVLILRVRVPTRAEELADESFDRLARRLAANAPIDNPAAFALGIARKLILEAETQAARQARALADPTTQPQSVEPDDADTDAARFALRFCLQRLDADKRSLILEYYACDGAARIAARQRMAQQQGMSLNALRNLALRLRETLQRCLRGRLAAGAANPGVMHRRKSTPST
ncbi:MAG: hypothetical protein JSR27_00985 [Proteobacteria bacterium]|nr:hypothetical protein [Pseudomonadota bacterium]